MSPTQLTLREASEKLAQGAFSSEELTTACLQRIRETDEAIGAFLHVDEAGALAQAREADERRAAGNSLGPLDGIPIGLKDNFSTKGIPTTCASRILEGYVPPFDSTNVVRLREAGAVLVGKLNMDEFAMGSSTETSAFGPTKNPWDLERNPGGSSGGSAAAVAARQVFGSLGTDTGGSIRQPAALTGIVGIKPTYGRCSRYGVVAYASSLDQVGTFGRTVEDAALLLEALVGQDPKDATSVAAPAPAWDAAAGVKGLRLGIPKEYFVEGLDQEVEASIRAAIQGLEAAGVEVVDVSLPHTEHAIATYYIVAAAEASSNLSRFDGIRFGLSQRDGSLQDLYENTRGQGFGPEVKRRLILGAHLLTSEQYGRYFQRAQQVRTLIRRDFDQAFEEVDALLTPAAPAAAAKLGAGAADPVQAYVSDLATLACNLAGLPGMSVPCGFTSEGLPVGMQLLGKPMDEATLFRLGAAYQASTDWHERSPKEVA